MVLTQLFRFQALKEELAESRRQIKTLEDQTAASQVRRAQGRAAACLVPALASVCCRVF